MVGIIIQLIISFLLIWLYERGGLRVLGLAPTKKRARDFVVYFLIAAFCSSSEFFMRMIFAEQRWQFNPDLSFRLILDGIWWNIKSVLFEELIFRGAIFYILIKKLGTTKAILVSAAAFGIYHWFSHEAFGNPGQMLITFVVTGAAGLVYAYGYAKTFSLYIPIAMHLGWNFVKSVVFSETIIGDQLLVHVKPVPEIQVSYFIFFCMLLLPIGSFYLINYLLLKNRKR